MRIPGCKALKHGARRCTESPQESPVLGVPFWCSVASAMFVEIHHGNKRCHVTVAFCCIVGTVAATVALSQLQVEMAGVRGTQWNLSATMK